MAAQPKAISPEEDLEALFESIAEQRTQDSVPVAKPERGSDNDAHGAQAPDARAVDVHHRIGQLTRDLHDNLCQLGYDKAVNKVMQELPDARDRLDYIAKLTGQAAEKALNCVDQGQALQSALGEQAKALSGDWERVFSQTASVDEFRTIAQNTREFLAQVPARSSEIGTVLTDIMMAQDFHDLTGQVIKKIANLAKYMEDQLLALLLETTPAELRAEMELHLHGPVVNPEGRTDVVTNQQQVDDMLEKLGF
jgi:chemotaxis protein CheZ